MFSLLFGRPFCSAMLVALLVACTSSPTTAITHVGGVARPGSSSYGDLLYVAGSRRSFVISYPQGQLVGTIDAPSYGTCSDSNGNVFLTGANEISEYAHGGTTPIATANVPGTAYSCAVDPTTGDIAVVVFCSTSCKGDAVEIFANLSATPSTYQDSALTQMLYCAYDNSGNLFVDGNNAGSFALAELPAGGTALTNLSVNYTLTQPGQVQWDGQYLTIETLYHPRVYRFSISGSNAIFANTISLGNIGKRAAESWIKGFAIVVPFGPRTKRPVEIGIWPYPTGGKREVLIKRLGHAHYQINGLTISAGQ